MHGFSVGPGQHKSGAGAALWADGSEDISVFVTLIGRQARPCAFLGPNAGSSVLLSNPRFILKPQFNWFALGQIGYVRGEGSAEVFLNVSMI